MLIDLQLCFQFFLLSVLLRHFDFLELIFLLDDLIFKSLHLSLEADQHEGVPPGQVLRRLIAIGSDVGRLVQLLNQFVAAPQLLDELGHPRLQPQIVLLGVVEVHLKLQVVVVQILLLVLHIRGDEPLPVLRHQEILDDLLRPLRVGHLNLLLVNQVWLNLPPVIKDHGSRHLRPPPETLARVISHGYGCQGPR